MRITGNRLRLRKFHITRLKNYDECRKKTRNSNESVAEVMLNRTMKNCNIRSMLSVLPIYYHIFHPNPAYPLPPPFIYPTIATWYTYKNLCWARVSFIFLSSSATGPYPESRNTWLRKSRKKKTESFLGSTGGTLPEGFPVSPKYMNEYV